jgi:hypothetical protein
MVAALVYRGSEARRAIYAKVDVPMLMRVAQPWPGDVSC